MTQENLTAIAVLIDKSGSMLSLQTDTIGSFNQFLSEQKLVPGEVLFTLCTFNTDYQLIHDSKSITNVPNLNNKTYSPSGGTALLDALGITIDSVGQKLAFLPEDKRPSKVLFLIITDGQENSSNRYTREQVKAMVTHQTEKYNWNFIFMGANIDAITEGSSLGIARQNSMQYSATTKGTEKLFKSISENVTRYRSSEPNTNMDWLPPVIITDKK